MFFIFALNVIGSEVTFSGLSWDISINDDGGIIERSDEQSLCERSREDLTVYGHRPAKGATSRNFSSIGERSGGHNPLSREENGKDMGR